MNVIKPKMYLGVKSTEKERVYKCPDCNAKYNNTEQMFKHVEDTHSENIPDGMSVKQYCFNRRNKKDHGSCTICRAETKWNEKKGRYERYCDDPACKAEAKRRAKENYKKKHNGEEYDISDPEHQKKMQFAKKNAGEYEFTDGGTVRYLCSYERDFLAHCDKELFITSVDLKECDVYFEYEYEGKKRCYIPDYIMDDIIFIIEVKDGGDNPNTHPKIRAIDKETEVLKDKAVIKDGRYNYIKIINKDYSEFDRLYKYLLDQSYNENGDKEVIISIPKPPKDSVAYKGPELNFLTKKESFNKFYDVFIKNQYNCRYLLYLNTNRIPDKYKNDDIIKNSATDLIVLREKTLDRDKNKIIEQHYQSFKEFNYYYTKKYEKYLHQDFLAVYMIPDVVKYVVLTFSCDNTDVKKEDSYIIQKLIDKYVKRGYYVLSTSEGYSVIIDTDVNKTFKKKENVKRIINQLNEIYSDRYYIKNKKLYEDTHDGKKMINVCLDGIPVVGSQEYSNLTVLIDYKK